MRRTSLCCVVQLRWMRLGALVSDMGFKTSTPEPIVQEVEQLKPGRFVVRVLFKIVLY